MIPKIIHHVWPGADPFRKRFHTWRASWMRKHPDWTFYFWRLDNLPDNISPDVRELANDPGFALCPKADMIRFEIVRVFGGIYVDTDMECLKPFDSFLHHEFFVGYEDDERRICPSVFGAVPNHPILTQMSLTSAGNAKRYGYELCNTQPHKYTSVKPFTKIVRVHQQQQQDDSSLDNQIEIYDRSYFYPVYFNEKHRLKEKTPGAYAKHHWTGNDPDGWTKGPRFA
jgi:mannosyltransferase OCH1-like enzyme